MDFRELSPEEQSAVANEFNYAVGYEECAAVASQYNIDSVYGVPVDEVISAALEDDSEEMCGSLGDCGKKKTKEEVEQECEEWAMAMKDWAPYCYNCHCYTEMSYRGWSGDVKNPNIHVAFVCPSCGGTTTYYK